MLRPGFPSDLLSFGHREAAHARLGPSKVPQPGVDLVNMAASPLVRACTIGSPQAKFLKGAEENQVERNILVATIAAAHPSTNGTPRTISGLGGTNFWQN